MGTRWSAVCVGWKQMVHAAMDDDGESENFRTLAKFASAWFYLILGFPLEAVVNDTFRHCLRRDQITPINSIISGTTKKISKVTHATFTSGNEFYDLSYQDFSAN